MRLSTSLSSRPKVGELVCGDTALVRSHQDRMLVAVVDALGHGPIAHEIANNALATLQQVPLDIQVIDVLSSLHRALRGSRGAAAMVCMLHGTSLQGCGVGNVELRCSHCTLPVMLSPGILGVNVRRYRVFQGSLQPGARLFIFSDGITTRLSVDAYFGKSAEDTSRAILENESYAHDDATILVVDVEA